MHTDNGRPPSALPLAIGFGVLFVLLLANEVMSYHAPPRLATAAVLGISTALVITALVHVRTALIVFVVWLVLSDDISRYTQTDLDGGLVSVLTLSIGGVALINPLALVLVALAVFAAVVRWSRTPARFSLLLPDVAVAAIVVLYLVATLMGLEWVLDNPRGALNSWNLPLMTAGLYTAFRVTPWPGRSLEIFWTAVLLAVGAKAFLWTLYFFLGIGVPFGGIVRVGFESGRVLFILLIAAACAAWVLREPEHLGARVLLAALALFAGFNVFVHAGRMEWLFAGLAIVLVWLFSPAQGKLRVALGVTAIGLAGFALIASYNPAVLSTLAYFASTLVFWDPELVTASRSTMVRVYEFANIRAELEEAGRMAIGFGPGGTFTDRHHPFPFPLTVDDFSLEERMSRQFQGAHGLLQNTLLVLGLAGTALYLIALAALYALAAAAYRHLPSNTERVIALALVGFLPAMMYLTWSAKSNMLFGILLGVLGVLVSRCSTQTDEQFPRAAG